MFLAFAARNLAGWFGLWGILFLGPRPFFERFDFDTTRPAPEQPQISYSFILVRFLLVCYRAFALDYK